MKKSQVLSLSLFFAMNAANAGIIGIVDSGNDFLHKDLQAKAWVNPIEIPNNDRDEDRNGYQDDIHGWNFAEGNSTLIDYSYSYSDTADVRKFFDVQLKSFLGTLSEEEREWANAKLKEEEFKKTLSLFGNWMHGTHVTGIAAKFSPDARMVGMKLIPTEIKLPGQKSNALVIETGDHRQVFNFKAADETPVRDALLKAAIVALAKQQSTMFGEIGLYLNGVKADVMNGSFGSSYAMISGIIGKVFSVAYRREATPEELKKFTDLYFSVALEEAKIFTRSSPKTLFIFAAGNDGANNDVTPSTPTNVVAENKISVAATLGEEAMATFSNYGATTVDVAAPGVGIISTSPMDKYLAVSGTSQAAPFVAGVAGAIKDANPELDFRGIKKIILETVDVKPWLKGKVITSGIVNSKRALRAAELSRTLGLVQAIAQAKNDVLGKSSGERSAVEHFQVPRSWVMPLPSALSIR